MHLSATVDFANIFIRYRYTQSTSELSLIVTEMVSTTGFFSIKKLFLLNESAYFLNSMQISFHVVF